MIASLFCLLLAWLLVWFLAPLTRWLGFRFGILDHPNHRKIHQEPIPCSGGIAIYLAFFGSLSLVLSINPNLYQEIGPRIIELSFIGALLLLLGIYDDRKNISAHWKLLAQIVILLIAMSLGFRIDILTNPFGGAFYLGWFSIPLTLFWFLGFINAMNLIDGLDGLSTGITAIVSLTLLLASIVFGDAGFSILMAGLAGATLSFLRFNFSHKRKIFLGDNGSMLLGFLLAGAAIIGAHKGTVFSVLLITILCLGVPIYDTASAIVRRLKRRVHIFSPDKEHVHHRFLKNGLTQVETALIIYGMTLLLGTIGLILTFGRNKMVALIIVISGMLIFLKKREWWFDRLKRVREIAYEVLSSRMDQPHLLKEKKSGSSPKIWVNKPDSFEEAERADDNYYRAMTPIERLETMQFLREVYFKLKKDLRDEGREGLRRSITVIK